MAEVTDTEIITMLQTVFATEDDWDLSREANVSERYVSQLNGRRPIKHVRNCGYPSGGVCRYVTP